jgi:hypothetical protein
MDAGTNLGVDQPKLSFSLVFSQSLLHKVFHDLLGDTDTGTARSQEDGSMVTRSNSRGLYSIDEATDDDSSSSLYVIVEHCIRMSIFLEGLEWVLPIFELNNDAVHS